MAGEPPPEPRSNQVSLASGRNRAAARGSTNSRSKVSSVGGRSGNAVKLIFAFQRSSSPKYSSRIAAVSGATVTFARRARRIRRSRNSRDVTRRAYNILCIDERSLLYGCRCRTSRHVSGEDGDGCGRHARNSQRVAERVRSNLREPLNNFARQSRHALERKVRRDPTALVFLGSCDLGFLATQVAGILDRRLDARDVDRRGHAVEPEVRHGAFRQKPFEPDFRLPQELACGYPIAVSRSHQRRVERLQIVRVP